MADLFNQQISATYSGLLKTTSSGVLTSSLTQITDGRGNGSPLYISTTVGAVDGAINFYGAYTFPSTDGFADQVLSTNAGGVLSWVDVGSGDVNVSGTPVADQIAIWTDATTIKGDPTLTIDTNREIILVQNGQSGTPSRGMYNIGGGNMSVATGEENTGFGKQNLNDIEGGYYNTAVGAYSLFSLTDGVYNVAIGHRSLYSLIDQSNNTAVGISSALNFIGSSGTFIGASSGNKRLSGNSNTAIGVNSLVGNSTVSLNTGDSNTAIGFASLSVVSSGSKNVALGKSSGSLITTGSSNVVIGNNTGTSIATLSNRIIISDGDGNIRQTFDNSGNATFNGSVTANNSFTNQIGLVVNGSTTGGIRQNFIAQGSSGTYNFQIGTTITANNAFEIIPSTAIDGTTFSTAVFKILNTGAATFSGALSGTSASFSGNLTCSNATTPRIIADGLSGPYAAFNLYFSGVEKGAFYADDTNKFILVGGTGDATYGTKILYGNGSLGLTIADTGAASFSGSVVIGGFQLPYLNFKTSDTVGAGWQYKQLSFSDATNTELWNIGYNYPNLQFLVLGTRVMTMTSGGNVGIGTDSPSGGFGTTSTGTLLDVYDGTTVGSNGGALVLSALSNSSRKVNLAQIRSFLTNGTPTAETGDLIFSTMAAATLTERVRITSGGVLQAKYGISFPNTAAPSIPANATTLNAYEEGTFTATMLNTGTTPSPTAASSYTRIGNTVTFKMYFDNVDITSSGSAVVSGLPYSGNGLNGYSTFLYTHGTAINNCKGGYVSNTLLVNLADDSTSNAYWITGTIKYAMFSGTYTI